MKEILGEPEEPFSRLRNSFGFLLSLLTFLLLLFPSMLWFPPVLTVFFFFLFCPLIYLSLDGLLFNLQKRAIWFDETGVVVQEFKKRQVRFEDIQRISAWLTLSLSLPGVKKEMNPCFQLESISIRRTEKDVFFLGTSHFTYSQLDEVFCLLKNEKKLQGIAWDFGAEGVDETGKRRTFSNEEVMKFFPHLRQENATMDEC